MVELGGAILGGMAPPVVALPAGLLFSYVVSKINARLAPLKSVVLFVAKGGFFTQGCLYPINVVVSAFDTNETINNKIIKPNGGGGM